MGTLGPKGPEGAKGPKGDAGTCSSQVCKKLIILRLFFLFIL